MLSHLTFFIDCSISFRPSFRLYVAAMQWRSACNVPVWVTMSSHSHPVLRYALKHVNFLKVSSPHKKPRTQFSPSTTATKNTRYQLTQRHATPFQLSRARPGSVGIMWLYGDIYSSTRLWVVGWNDGASLFPILLSIFLNGYVHIHAVYVRGKAAPTPVTRISIEVR